MNLSNRYAWPSLGWCVLLVTGIVLGAGNVLGADDAKPQPAAKDAPSGLRCIFKMNGTLIGNFDVIAKAAGIKYQSYGYGSDLDKPLRQGFKFLEDTPQTLMKKGEVDVCLTTHANWAAEPDIEKWAAIGFAGNPKFRLYHQARFLVADGLGLKKPEDRDNTKIPDLQAVLDKNRKRLEIRVDAINKEIGKQVVFIVPVGDAIVKLREMVVDGKYPGVTKQSELFKDALHAKEHVNLLTAYCNFAAIYQKSPEGMKLKMPGIDDTQHAILQKLAWETVSRYPHAGLTK
jgi:hypothetical protein